MASESRLAQPSPNDTKSGSLESNKFIEFRLADRLSEREAIRWLFVTIRCIRGIQCGVDNKY